jgi:hypothetical protein
MQICKLWCNTKKEKLEVMVKLLIEKHKEVDGLEEKRNYERRINTIQRFKK